METFWPWKQNIRRSHTTTSVQFTFCQSLWEPPHPPSIFTVGELASLEGVPQGTLSHTHLGSDTVALNETRHLRLGLAFQSQTCTWGRCGDAVLAYLRHLKQEVRLKGDSERDQTHRWEIFLHFHLCLHSIFTSISYPDWPPNADSDGRCSTSSSSNRAHTLWQMSTSTSLHHIAQYPWNVSQC